MKLQQHNRPHRNEGRHYVQQHHRRHQPERGDRPEIAAYNAGTNTLTVHSNVNSDTSQLVTAINAEGTFSASTAGAGLGTYAAGTLGNVTTGDATGSSAML